MHYSRSKRLRRRKGDPAQPHRLRNIFAVVIAVVGALALFNLFRLLEPRGTVESRTGSANSPEVNSISAALPSRPNFGYSVIPGGASDAQELTRAVTRDPVVGAALPRSQPGHDARGENHVGPAGLCVVSRRRPCLLDEEKEFASAVVNHPHQRPDRNPCALRQLHFAGADAANFRGRTRRIAV